MADISTTYMGIALKNPVIAGASGLTANMEKIRQIEAVGAGALVIKSLMEEEIQLEHFKFDEDLHKDDALNAEMVTTLPEVNFDGTGEHLMWVREAKQAVDIPVFASLNAVDDETWIEYAQKLQETGVDGLECNIFASPNHPEKDAATVENEQVELVGTLKKTLSIPFSVKLSFFYTNPLHVIHRMDEAGASGFVLFNRLFDPDVDVKSETHTSPFNLTHENDARVPLRYTGLLEGTLSGDICCSTGIHSGTQVAKMILAGAAAVQTVSALYRHKIDYIQTMLSDLEGWMDEKGYGCLNDFRGKLSQRHSSDPWAYTRAQYAKLLMRPGKLIHNTSAL